MATTNSERRDSSTELLHELQSLGQSLFQSKTNRRAPSLVLDRPSASVVSGTDRSDRGSISHRLSSSPWQAKNHAPLQTEPDATSRKKKGMWSWKPLRALSHLRMQRIGCLFSVKVVGIRGLPASTNGLRLSVAVHKKKTRAWSVRTMPFRVDQGVVGFNETLFVGCHLYSHGKPAVFEPRLFMISVVAVDAPELDLGSSTVDLSLLVEESVKRSSEGARVREWDVSYELAGKAKGGELVLKLGFQIMEEGGVSIYSQAEGLMKSIKGKESVSSSSFRSSPLVQKLESELEPPGLEIVDMGIEKEVKSEETSESISMSREVVKEVVHQRMLELESIAKEIKALESTMTRSLIDATKGGQQLDADEDMVTREFLRMLDDELNEPIVKTSSSKEATKESEDHEAQVLIPDLGKGLGPVVQTKDGGYLVSTNPFNMKAEREEKPKLTVQISRPFILQDHKQESRLELLQMLAEMSPEELKTKLQSLTAMDELMGKTAEQVAFEGVASAVIRGRNKEGSGFSAARSVTTAKMMAKAMVARSEKTSTGISVTIDEILASSMQMMVEMAVEGLKIQAEMAEEEAPKDISNPVGTEATKQLLDSAISLEEWAGNCEGNDTIEILLTIQPRDPNQRFEPVGGIQLAVLQAVRIDSIEDEEKRFKVIEIHLGGLKLRTDEGQMQMQRSLQWLMSIGKAKAGWNKRDMAAKIRKDLVWSLSSGMEDDMWCKPRRNPNVKFSFGSS